MSVFCCYLIFLSAPLKLDFQYYIKKLFPLSYNILCLEGILLKYSWRKKQNKKLCNKFIINKNLPKKPEKKTFLVFFT